MKPKVKLKLIPEAKKAHKYWSNRFNVITIILAFCELANLFYGILPLWENVIPDHIFMKLIPLSASLSFLSRYFQQRLNDDDIDSTG